MTTGTLPSQSELKRVFHYDPVSGDLRWRIRPSRNVAPGSIASTPCSKGYLRVQWRGKTLKVHRVAWKYTTGADAVTVDHINRDTTDNRIDNLREATQKEQNSNRHIKRNSKDDFVRMVIESTRDAAKTRRQIAVSPLPSKEYLWTLFSYDEETGILTHNTASRNNKRRIGAAVTCNVKGHLKTYVRGGERYVHRIVWKMMTGVDAIEIDHINRDRSDNRWCNLRDVSHYRNIGNTDLSKRNKSGVKGVYWAKDKNKWTAQISIGDKIKYLGRYTKIEDAKAAYEAAARIHFGDNTSTLEMIA